MIDATTYYVFSNDIDTDISALDAEDTDRFRPGELTAVVRRRDYDKLRDLTEKMAASAKALIELEERRAKLRVEIAGTAHAMISEGLQERNKQLIADAAKLLKGLKDAEKTPWDDECEAKARELMSGFVNDAGKPPLGEQQAVANRLNQMMPYPGWVFAVVSGGGVYWVVSHDQMGVVHHLTYGYRHSVKDKTADTLMEMITQLELGL